MKKMSSSIPLISKQSGNAAILFALLIPVLFGIFMLASDGARALQSKARLDDALEAASLVVSVDDTNGERITRYYIEQYMPGTSSVASITVPPSTTVNSGGLPFIQYSVTATTTQNSWFPGNEAIKGFGDTFNTSGRSVAQKYQTEAVDIVFAADFSGSMYDEWKGSGRKYEDLLGAVSDVTDELKKYNDNVDMNEPKNTVALTAFNIYTNRYSNLLSWCYADEKSYVTDATFPSIPKIVFFLPLAIIDIIKVFTNQVDYKETIKNIFTRKKCRETISTFYLVKPLFNDIQPTDKFEDFNAEIKYFLPTLFGDTASYQGIIRAAQLANSGENRRRLIILLTDGHNTSNGLIPGLESLVGQTGDHEHYLQQLVKKREFDGYDENMGMCDFIRTKLNEKEVDGKNVETKIAVIGFDYNPESNTGLKNCADVVFDAKNKEDIKNKILSLINEEVGHLSL